jgi:hypothetical protein
MNKIDKIIDIVRKNIQEEIAANAASSGNFAGLPPDEPPVRVRKKERKYMKSPGRKIWLEFLRSSNGRRS